MALGKSVGRVSIRVVPDATKFRQDLVKVLQRAERTLQANIAVTADTRPFTADLQKLVKEWSGKEVKLDVDAITAGATAHIKEVARPRKATLVLDANVKPALAKIGGLLATVTGGKALQGVARDLGNVFTGTLDNLPKIALLGTTIIGLGAAGLNAVHGLGAATAQLSQLASLTALLPGGLAAAAIGVVTLVLAFSKVPGSVSSAAKAYKSLQSIVATDFWSEAAKPVRSFLTGVLPQVKTGFAETAKSIGGALGAVATDLRSTLGGGALSFIFSQVAASVDAARPGLIAFSEVFTSLLGVGAQYLPQFGSWVTQIGQQFLTWIAGLQASGQLDDLIQGAVITLGHLSSILGDIGSIFVGIFTAGGGTDALGGLAAGLASVASVVNSAGFQTGLGTIFAGASQGASALASVLPAIGTAIGALAPTISSILTLAGSSLASLLGSVAAAISTPAFQDGLTGFFSGIQAGIDGIGPSLPFLAEAFGSLGRFAGQLAAQLGPVLGAVFQALAPVVTQLLDAVAPLLPVLGQGLITAVQTLAPTLLTLLQAILPILPPLFQLAADVLPEAASNFSLLVQALGPLMPVISPLLVALPQILQVLDWIINATDGIAQFGLAMLSGVSSVNLASDALKGKFGPIIQWVTQLGYQLGQGFVDAVGLAKGGINALLQAVQNGINSAIDSLNLLASGLNVALDGIRAISGGAIDLHIGKIPHVSIPKLALGATILPKPGGTIARLAEAGRAETVVDTGVLNRELALVNARLQGQSAATSDAAGAVVHVHPSQGMDERLLGRYVGRELDDLMAGR